MTTPAITTTAITQITNVIAIPAVTIITATKLKI
jgi:hypothetical protein